MMKVQFSYHGVTWHGTNITLRKTYKILVIYISGREVIWISINQFQIWAHVEFTIIFLSNKKERKFEVICYIFKFLIFNNFGLIIIYCLEMFHS